MKTVTTGKDRLSLHDVNGVFVGQVRPHVVRFLRLCGLRRSTNGGSAKISHLSAFGPWLATLSHRGDS